MGGLTHIQDIVVWDLELEFWYVYACIALPYRWGRGYLDWFLEFGIWYLEFGILEVFQSYVHHSKEKA